MPPPVVGRKIDCTESSVLPAHVNELWPVVTDVQRWPEWLRDAKGRGLVKLTKLTGDTGKIDPKAATGGRYALEFSNGLRGEWEVNYWVEPAQISLRLLPETRQDAQGLQHVIFDLDFFPKPDGRTQLWFGMLLLLEPKFKPGRFARWPAKDVQAWVHGFHQNVAKVAATLPQGKAAQVLAREAR